ncbi:MAG: YbhB/YbcL family Raf kinase inhibitor-like protein [Candidatus Paceibacterota bacterium]
MNDLERNGLTLSSTAFEEGKDLPVKYTCDGDNISPPLTISGVDEEARSLVLTMDDPDAPTGVFDHWIVFDILPETTDIPEGQDPDGTLGVGTSGNIGYYGPCPPVGERHRYLFTLYSLDALLNLSEGVTKDDVMVAMTGNVLQKIVLPTHFKRRGV